MKKIEIIWRELLYQAIEKRTRQFTQKEVAAKFGFSTSTVFQALKAPRKMGAVRVSGRFFVLEDPEKLLYHWASIRNPGKEIILSGRVELPLYEIEGRMPPNIVYGGFSAARTLLGGEVPADYDKVYVYLKLKTPRQRTGKQNSLQFGRAKGRAGGQAKLKIKEQNSDIVRALQERFEITKGIPNLFVLRADEFLAQYGQTTSLAQTFADLWNLSEWYAKEFIKTLKGKIDGLLS